MPMQKVFLLSSNVQLLWVFDWPWLEILMHDVPVH